MKRALVLSGGGSRGAYQVGVLSQLSKYVEGGFQYISGTSVGAINAVGIAHFKPEEFHLGAQWVENLWTQDIKNTKSIWKKRFPPYIAGLFNMSIGQTKPLRQLLHRVVDEDQVRASGIELRMPAVNIETGELRVYTQHDNLITAQMASSAFPGAFPPEYDQGSYWTDGGVRDIAPLRGAIEWGAAEIYVILTRTPERIYGKKEYKSTLGLLRATVEIMTMEVMLNDIRRCMDINERIKEGSAALGHRPITLHVIIPSEKLGDSLLFEQYLIQPQIALGKRDTVSLYG